jgi:hypothetical protein
MPESHGRDGTIWLPNEMPRLALADCCYGLTRQVLFPGLKAETVSSCYFAVDDRSSVHLRGVILERM